MSNKALSISALIIALILIFLGAFGMLITFIFMWSSDVREIAGAGFGFVAGSILLGCGSISLSHLSRRG